MYYALTILDLGFSGERGILLKTVNGRIDSQERGR